MNLKSKPKNPFYAACVVAGMVFAITACAYGVMTVQGLGEMRATDAAAQPANSEQPANPLMEFLDRHGVVVLMVELIVLGAVCFAAMGTDNYWTARHEARLATDKKAKSNSA